jgi:hypothetical protein
MSFGFLLGCIFCSFFLEVLSLFYDVHVHTKGAVHAKVVCTLRWIPDSWLQSKRMGLTNLGFVFMGNSFTLDP